MQNNESLHAASSPLSTIVSETSQPSSKIHQQWLTWQCQMVANAVNGVLYTVQASGELRSVCSWPGERKEPCLNELAVSVLEDASPLNVGGIRYGAANKRLGDVVASPIIVDEKIQSILIILISPRSEAQRQGVLQLLQWGGLWFDHLNTESINNKLTKSLSTEILGANNLAQAAELLCEKFAQVFSCNRASFSLYRGLSRQVLAAYPVAKLSDGGALEQDLSSLHLESIDQQSHIWLTNEAVTLDPLKYQAAHEKFSLRHETKPSSFYLGIEQEEELQAETSVVISLETSKPLTQGQHQAMVDLLPLLQSLIGFQIKQQRTIWSRLKARLVKGSCRLLGPEHLTLKMALLCLGAFFLLAANIQGDYKVAAPAKIEGAMRQLLMAPQDSYIKKALFKAGDVVEQGQLIASLDDQELQLQRRKWEAEHVKVEKQYHNALAMRDRSELTIFQAQLQQVEAEIALIRDKISRTQLRAPFAGILVSGDLSKMQGAPVKAAEVLFELAPLDQYRVVLEVDESQIGGLASGQLGLLALSAFLGETYSLSIERIVPVVIAENGRNFFRVEAILNGDAQALRPGMEGVAKVTVGQRSWLWIMTHRLLERLRLWFWSLGI